MFVHPLIILEPRYRIIFIDNTHIIAEYVTFPVFT